MNFDWENQSSSTQYQFVSNYQGPGDELVITPATSTNIITDLSAPRAFRPPVANLLGSEPFFPVLINDTPLCMQNATITFSAQPNTLVDSCTGGWQTVLGMGAVNVTFTGTSTCNDTSLIPDIGECNRLRIFTDMCDLTKMWDFQYFVMAGKDGLTVDTATGGAVTFTVNMTYSIAPCDCVTTAVGYIVDPNGVYWVGTAA